SDRRWRQERVEVMDEIAPRSGAPAPRPVRAHLQHHLGASALRVRHPHEVRRLLTERVVARVTHDADHRKPGTVLSLETDALAQCTAAGPEVRGHVLV